MTEIDQLIQIIYQNNQNKNDINKFYSFFLRTNLYMPIEKETNELAMPQADNEDIPFTPLYAEHEGNFFIPIFDTLEKLTVWAEHHFQDMSYVTILGRELIKGISEKAYLCLNLKSNFYKEFSPEEIAHLKITVAKTEKIITANGARKN